MNQDTKGSRGDVEAKGGEKKGDRCMQCSVRSFGSLETAEVLSSNVLVPRLVHLWGVSSPVFTCEARPRSGFTC